MAKATPEEQTEKDQLDRTYRESLSQEDVESGVKQAESHANQSFYNNGGQPKGSQPFGWVGRHRKKLVTGGILGVLTGGGLIGLFSFLAPLKLDFLGKNIEQTQLDRLEYTVNGRSQRFMYHLMMAEIAGNNGGDPSNNRYFRAKGWYLSGNPLTQWYKDIRTDKFFNVMEQKYGVIFAAESGNARGHLRAITTIDMPESKVDSLRQLFKDIDTPNGIDVAKLNEFEGAVVNEFDNDRDARRMIRSFIKDDSHAWQVLKRRHLRRWAGERLGIRRWRFFEGTRDKTGKSVRTTWSKLTGNTMTGKIIGCIFSFALCPVDSNDLNDNDNKVENGNDPNTQRSVDDTETDIDDGQERAKGQLGKADERSRIQKLISRKLIILRGVNILDWLRTFIAIDDNISSRKLTKMVAISRAAEYATAYMTFVTLTDHLKEGETVTGEEVNAAMQMFQCSEFSEAYQHMMAKQNSGSKTANIGAVYAQQKQRTTKECPYYEEVTDELKVNGHGSNAAKIEKWYNDTIGPVIGEIVDAVRFLVENPVSAAILSVLDSIFNFLLQGLLVIVNFIWDESEEAIKKLLNKLGEEVISGLGGAPQCTANESGGRKVGCAIGGAAVTQEQYLASIGGMNLTDDQVNEVKQKVAFAKQQDRAATSWWHRLASTEDPNSLLARTAMRLPSNTSQLASEFSNLASSFTPTSRLTASGQALAATISDSALAVPDPDENLFGVEYKGFLNKTIEKSLPYDGKAKDKAGEQALLDAIADGRIKAEPPAGNCEDEMAAHTAQLVGDDDIKTDDDGPTMMSVCKLDTAISEAMKSFFTEEDDGGIGTSTSIDGSGETGVNGLECPDKLQENPTHPGYYKMPEAPSGEYVIYSVDARRYGSKELVCSIYTVALAYKDKYGNKSTVNVGDLNGGYPHASHYKGIAVDIDAHGQICAADHTHPTPGDGSGLCGPYNAEATVDLGKMWIDTGILQDIWWCEKPGDGSTEAIRIYGEQKGKPVNIKCLSGHDNHFHVNIQEKYALPGSWTP